MPPPDAKPPQPRIATVAARIAAVIAIVLTITYVLTRLLPVNASTAGFAFLLAILFTATQWGLVEATVGSVTAVLCYNFFFLPPVGTFTITDPQNWVALFALLATSITASRLSAHARAQALEAHERRQEIEQLYALSRSILLIDPTQSVPRQLVNQLAQTFRAASVVLHDHASGETVRAGRDEIPGAEEQTTTIQLGGQPVGSLGFTGIDLSDSARQSLTNLVAIGLERARAQEAAGRAEAARQSDELKSTLLDAIAHEFKTPLTTIKASTTALLSPRPPKPEQQREYITLMDEEADRLSGLVSEAIQMARIEAGQVRLQLEETHIAELLEAVLTKMKSVLEDRPITIDIAPHLPPVMIDREMMEMTVRQLLDNALKYSPAGTPLTLSAALENGQVVTRVADRGPGIAQSELSRIFGKFYRAKDLRNQVPGAGLGLAIARAVVTAHAGVIWAESQPSEGAQFCIALAPAPANAGENA